MPAPLKKTICQLRQVLKYTFIRFGSLLSQLSSSNPAGSKKFQESKKDKVKKHHGKKKKKSKTSAASFKRPGKKVSGMKAPPSSTGATEGSGDGDKFLDYDLTHLPKEAYPDRTRANQGKQSYTIQFSGARVEILLEKKAFFIKMVAAGSPGPKGQITWSKYGGPHAAWDVVKQRSGINRPRDFAS